MCSLRSTPPCTCLCLCFGVGVHDARDPGRRGHGIRRYYDSYFVRAQQVRAWVQADFAAAFAQVHILLTPTTPTPPRPAVASADAVTPFLADVFTVPASLAGAAARGNVHAVVPLTEAWGASWQACQC
jgi:hypothetical protein